MHGLETGVIVRSPDGGYSEKHRPLSRYAAYELIAREPLLPIPPPPDADENGVRRPHRRRDRIRAALSRFYFADAVQPPAADELTAAQHGPARPELDGRPHSRRQS